MAKLIKGKKSKSNPKDGYFDDCPICQAMKKQGIKMEYHSDDSDNEGVWEEGFYQAKTSPKDLEKMKKLFKDSGGEIIEDN